MKKFKSFYNLYSLQRRFIAIILILVIGFICLFSRLFYIQIFDGKRLQVLATSEWLRGLPLSSKRGEIYDTNKTSLATTITTYDVYVRARNVLDVETLANELADKLDISYQTAFRKVTDKSTSEVLIKMQVDENVAKELTKFKGVYLSQNVKRVYPYSNMLTQVLGYCTIDNIGQAGIESYYDKFLRGVDGKSLVQTNAQGSELDNSLAYYIPSIAGADVYTTIDLKMQTILEEELYKAYVENKAINTSGIILGKSGEIKAMSCVPSFDLNNVPRNDIETLQQLTKNLGVVDVYEPGSTFKLITLTAALNEGLTDLDEHFYCGGRCSVDGETIKCWKSTGHGSQTLVEAFKNSCNCVFVNLALRLGVDKFYEYLKLFGIGEKTGVDISSESSGIVMPKEQVRIVDLARIGFGHAIAVTELQMASVYEKITTGTNSTPHILNKIATEDKILFENNATHKKLEIKEEVRKKVNQLLFNNINSENNMTFIPGYSVGGKTGTAQKYGENGQIAVGKYIASFIGTYPADNPEYIMLICVNEPSNGAYYGGVVAKPVGQKVFERIFSELSISPTDSSQLTNTPNVTMPNLVGLSVANASAKLKTLGLDCVIEGDGDRVIANLPETNTMLYTGEIVYLITN